MASADPLFVTDAQIRKRMGVGERLWRGSIAKMERDGFPKRDRILRRRYWPAVKAWLDRRAGLGLDLYEDGFVPADPANEHWEHEHKRRRASARA